MVRVLEASTASVRSHSTAASSLSQLDITPDVETVVEISRTLALEKVGSSSWRKLGRALRRLRDAAYAKAVSSERKGDVRSSFTSIISTEVMEALALELVRAEAWRTEVLPRALRSSPEMFAVNPATTYAASIALHRECVVLNIFELVAHDSEGWSSIASDEVAAELCDYCHRAIARLVSETPLNDELTASMESRIAEVEFSLSMSALGVLRGITDSIQDLPISICSRLLDSCDATSALAAAVDSKPWMRRSRDGTLRLYIDGSWHEVTKSEEWDVFSGVSKCEAQVWLALRTLVCDARFAWDDRGVAMAERLRRRLNEPIIDQIPVLSDLAATLDRAIALNASHKTKATRGFVLEIIPCLRAQVFSGGSERFEEAARTMLMEHFNPRNTDFARSIAEDALDLASETVSSNVSIEFDVEKYRSRSVHIDILRERQSLSSTEVSFDTILTLDCDFDKEPPRQIMTSTSKLRALRRKLVIDDKARSTTLPPFDGKIRVSLNARTVSEPVSLRHTAGASRVWITVGSVTNHGFAVQIRLDVDRTQGSAVRYCVGEALASVVTL